MKTTALLASFFVAALAGVQAGPTVATQTWSVSELEALGPHGHNPIIEKLKTAGSDDAESKGTVASHFYQREQLGIQSPRHWKYSAALLILMDNCIAAFQLQQGPSPALDLVANPAGDQSADSIERVYFQILEGPAEAGGRHCVPTQIHGAAQGGPYHIQSFRSDSSDSIDGLLLQYIQENPLIQTTNADGTSSAKL
ncbi:hypothetical protein BJ085DRAFT_27204 [Dimargaris cristalligena]|uniref:Uncharacterized protein n=1 Tax=Dimargaris cristalligena TaxID=215637 RepID=A0A4Q0A1T0_9FUNG|nr:hypothetical protein BJ085DRAFT_27204 [Dimargaris cristalligena]|eukprot:RKP40043.1 hypothetical protein BJ085DRAFT_27204 [Dimargaris cristalligena]